MKDADVRPEQLVLEVTDDDFGTGYSSLGRLQTLPVDSIKIDKSFDAAHEAIAQVGFSTHSGERGQPEVLLVEDDRATRLLISTTLTSDGWRVHEAGTIRAGERLGTAAAGVGTADRETKARAFSAGADDYIVKPISGPQLTARMRGAVLAESRRHPG